jgi:ATP-binding cassette subfamily B protein
MGTYVQAQRTYTRLGGYTADFAHKTLVTDYQNIEPQKKQKILGKAAQSLSSNWRGVEHLMIQTTEFSILIFGIISYGSAILLLDWKILVVTLAMFVFDVLLRTHAIKYSDSKREESSEIWRKKNYIMQKSLNVSAGKDIRIYQLGNWFHKLLCEVVTARGKLEKKLQLRWYFPTVSGTFFNFGRDFIAYSILIKRVLYGQMDIATFTLYLGLINGFTNWIYSLSERFNNLRKSSHEFNDYHDFMNLPDKERKLPAVPELVEGVEGPASSNTTAPEIIFKNVSFAYPDEEKNTIRNLDFTIKAGEKIALVGNNGAGKTTIVKLLCGLYDQTQGEILIDGKTIDDIGLDAYQDKISVLFQDTNPMAFTIEENITGLEEGQCDKNKLQDSLKKSGLWDKVQSLPQKEKTHITQTFSEDGILLSGGETQKLLFAKAIYKNGSFLILDEPTSALDPLAESKIYEEYNNLAQGKTAVFISHRLASTKFCDRIMFLENGSIAECGSHDELMAKGGKYKEMFDIQAQYYKEEAVHENK